MALEPGTRIASYEIVSLIAEGGQGEVYRARQLSLKREVALKVMRPDTESEKAARRFRREIDIHTRLSHPNLVTVIDGGLEGEVLYLAMELVDGSPLAADAGHLTVREWVSRARPLAEAIAYLHGAKVLHRDLKPSNVLVDDEGRVKVTDFGLSRRADMTLLTAVDQTMGTPHYMPGEVIVGGEWSEAGDLYSLGVIYYQLLTGSLPYPAGSLYEYVHAVNAGLAAPLSRRRPGLPAALDSMVMRMLSREAEARPGVAEVLRILQEVEEDPVAGVARSAPVPRVAAVAAGTTGGPQGSRAPRLAMVVLVLGLAGAVAVGWRQEKAPEVTVVTSSGPSPVEDGLDGRQLLTTHMIRMQELSGQLRDAFAEINRDLGLPGAGTNTRWRTLEKRAYFELRSALHDADSTGLTTADWLLLAYQGHEVLEVMHRPQVLRDHGGDREVGQLIEQVEKPSTDPGRRCLTHIYLAFLAPPNAKHLEDARLEAYERCLAETEPLIAGGHDELRYRYHVLFYRTSIADVVQEEDELQGLIGNSAGPVKGGPRPWVAPRRRALEASRETAARLALVPPGQSPEEKHLTRYMFAEALEAALDVVDLDEDLAAAAILLVDQLLPRLEPTDGEEARKRLGIPRLQELVKKRNLELAHLGLDRSGTLNPGVNPVER